MFIISDTYSLICNIVSLNVEELWHQRLDHVNNKLLEKISSLETIKDLPTISIIPNYIYGPYPLGKQSKS